MRRPRVTYVVNHAAFFVSHRLPLALGAENAGYEVALLTGQAGSKTMEPAAELELSRHKIKHKRVAFGSGSLNPVLELWALLQLTRELRQSRPDIVHCASPKGLLYGGLAARLAGVKCLVLAVSGMGFAFTSGTRAGPRRKLIAAVYMASLRIVLRHPNCTVIVQNTDDRRTYLEAGLASPKQLRLIPGSGVDLQKVVQAAIPKQPIVLFPARMLRDKGLAEFVDAARAIRAEEPGWRFVLAGAADYDNPTSIDADAIRVWQSQGIVEWLGHVEDMAPLFAAASIVCLPSYREGMPKSLLEAAAAGCAVVTTDVTGCREAIIDGQTGDLVPVRNGSALAQALLTLMRDAPRRHQYGANGRRLAAERFSVTSVVQETLIIYRKLLEQHD